MTRPILPPGAAPAGEANPAVTPAELYEWLARRRKTQRKVMIAALVVIAVVVATAAAYFTAFSRQLVAVNYLRSHTFLVDWDLNWSNFRTGGVTTVAYRPEYWARQEPSASVLDAVKSLKHVTSLDVSLMVQLRDDDLAVVASLVELEDLELNRDTASGLEPLARTAGPGGQPATPFNPLTDRVLDHVQGLTRLEVLGLSGNRITDAGLAKLANLQSLEMLDLDGTSVTNAGLDALVGLKALKTLRLQGTRVTRRGVTRFQLKRPDVEVIFERNFDENGTPL